MLVTWSVSRWKEIFLGLFDVNVKLTGITVLNQKNIKWARVWWDGEKN